MSELLINKKFRLPKEFAEKWLASLRSGKYRQGTEGMLFQRAKKGRHNRYCCLGVACAISGFTVREIGSSVYISRDEDSLDIKIFESELIPNELIGTPSSNELVGILSAMNDGNEDLQLKPKSFKEIADWIEQNVILY